VDTSDALNSSGWLDIRVESITEFLQIECLNVMEVDLIRALIRWGKYQMQQDLDEGGNLRSKILPGMQQIRFDSLTHEEFVEMCQEYLDEVLTDGEQSSIFKSITSKDIWKPTEVSPAKLAPRHGPYIFCNVESKRDYQRDNRHETFSLLLLFQVDSLAEFAGINFKSSSSGQITNFDLCMGSKTRIAGGSSTLTTTSRGKDEFCKSTPMCTLVAGITYTLKFTFSGTKSRYYEAYTIPYPRSRRVSDKLTVDIETTQICVEVVDLVFRE
jgi:hypothetical protein